MGTCWPGKAHTQPPGIGAIRSITVRARYPVRRHAAMLAALCTPACACSVRRSTASVFCNCLARQSIHLLSYSRPASKNQGLKDPGSHDSIKLAQHTVQPHLVRAARVAAAVVIVRIAAFIVTARDLLRRHLIGHRTRAQLGRVFIAVCAGLVGICIQVTTETNRVYNRIQVKPAAKLRARAPAWVAGVSVRFQH